MPRLCQLLALLLACAPTAASEPPDRHVIPHGLVHVTFQATDTAPATRLSLPDALALRDAIAREHRTTYRDADHHAWFFHAFDRRTLEFLVARWQPLAHGGRYHTERRILVRRTRRSAAAFDLTDLLAQYDHGTGDLRAGMTPDQVVSRRGPPEHTQQLGPVGSFDYLYPDLCARFLSNRVAHLWPRTACTPPS